MATDGVQPSSRVVLLSPDDSPGYTNAGPLTEESARKTSELLSLNHDLYHTRFNSGFHNHLVHHLLAIWALGGSPREIEEMWEYNNSYQAPLQRPDEPHPTSLDLSDPKVFKSFLGNDDCYPVFLRFFEDEITEKGVPDVLREYLLKGDERADDIFCRMYTDLVHPIIHLGCALEFNQPSLVAEALAAACVHDDWPKRFLLATEDYVRSNPDVPSTSLLEILDNLRKDPEISTVTKSSTEFNKVRVLAEQVSGEQLAPYLAQFQVKPTPEDLQTKLSDMMYNCAYMVAAAQVPGKRETLDFVTLHSVTLAVFYPAILAIDWLSDNEKARLLEAKTRTDAVMFAAAACPVLYPARVIDYVPRHPEHGWSELICRSVAYPDEGHVVKAMRALLSLEQLGEAPADFPISRADVVKIAHMVVDSTEAAMQPGGHNIPEVVSQAIINNVGIGGEMVLCNMMRWVFYGGVDNAWKWVPDLKLSNGHLPPL